MSQTEQTADEAQTEDEESEQTTETVQMAQTKTTDNYGVYDSPDGDEPQQMVGTYITNQVAEQVGEFIEVTLQSGEGDGLTLTPDKETSSFVVFSDDTDAVEASYVSHEVLERIGADGDEPRVSAQVSPSTEEAFEAALEAQTTSEEEQEEAADALLADEDGDEGEDEPSQEEAAEALVSDDTDAESDEGESEVQVSDDELGI